MSTVAVVFIIQTRQVIFVNVENVAVVFIAMDKYVNSLPVMAFIRFLQGCEVRIENNPSRGSLFGITRLCYRVSNKVFIGTRVLEALWSYPGPPTGIVLNTQASG